MQTHGIKKGTMGGPVKALGDRGTAERSLILPVCRHEIKPSLHPERPESGPRSKMPWLSADRCYEFPEGRTPKRIFNKSPCFLCFLGFLTFIERLVNIAEMGESEEEVWEMEGNKSIRKLCVLFPMTQAAA
jgi:hypothetical protein